MCRVDAPPLPRAGCQPPPDVTALPQVRRMSVSTATCLDLSQPHCLAGARKARSRAFTAILQQPGGHDADRLDSSDLDPAQEFPQQVPDLPGIAIITSIDRDPHENPGSAVRAT